MKEFPVAVVERARAVRLAIFDVDGVLTDGSLRYGAEGEDCKVFHSLDGHGVKMLTGAGVAVALLSGRRSHAVERRAAELGIGHVLQGVETKLPAWQELLSRLRLDAAQSAFMGDDLPDLPVLIRCGLALAPANAHEEVRARVHYVSLATGGRGAVREVCDLVLAAQGRLAALTAAYLE